MSGGEPSAHYHAAPASAGHPVDQRGGHHWRVRGDSDRIRIQLPGSGHSSTNASWGNLLLNAQNYLYRDPLLAVYPGVLILLVVLAFNFMGDGLRELVDPQTVRVRRH